MNNKIVFGLAASIALTGCGGSSGGSSNSSTESFSVNELVPVSGSDSILGVWVGEATFTEKDDWGDGFVQYYAGDRLVVLQIRENGIGGYRLTSCDGFDSPVIYDPHNNSLSTLNRTFTVTNFNEMTGTSTQTALNGTEAQETWNWVKVSNNTNNIGTVTFSPSENAELLSLCRNSYKYSDTEGTTWTTLADNGSYKLNGFNESFDVQEDSDGWEYLYFSEPQEEIEIVAGNGSTLSVINSSPIAYSATYSTGSAFSATLKTLIVD